MNECVLIILTIALTWLPLGPGAALEELSLGGEDLRTSRDSLGRFVPYCHTHWTFCEGETWALLGAGDGHTDQALP